MRQLALLDQHQLGLREASDQPISYTRRAARAVLFNAAGQVAVMHFTAISSYKLPGGGIDEGEDTIAALHREIREETGYEITDIKELGEVVEYRYYCGMHQVSYCYTATATQFVGTQLTQKEQNGGMELQWFDTIPQAVAAIVSGHQVDEDGSPIGLKMMIQRDVAILKAVQS